MALFFLVKDTILTKTLREENKRIKYYLQVFGLSQIRRIKLPFTDVSGTWLGEGNKELGLGKSDTHETSKWRCQVRSQK